MGFNMNINRISGKYTMLNNNCGNNSVSKSMNNLNRTIGNNMGNINNPHNLCQGNINLNNINKPNTNNQEKGKEILPRKNKVIQDNTNIPKIL